MRTVRSTTSTRRQSRTPKNRPTVPAFIIGLVGVIIVFGLIAPVVWSAMKLTRDDGPLLYPQKRYGKDRQLFTMWKFRSLPRGTDKNEPVVMADGTPPTRLGKLMRPAMIDELPQVINLLNGTMVLFNPRANEPRQHEDFVAAIPRFEERLSVVPGLLPLGHLMHRNPRAPQSPAEHIANNAKYLAEDLRFIANPSPWNKAKTLYYLARYLLLLALMYVEADAAKLKSRWRRNPDDPGSTTAFGQ